MKIKYSILVFIISFSCVKMNAQNYELGKVSIEQLKEKVNPKDTTAPATFLFKKGKTFFSYDRTNGFTVNHVYEFKIKIYKKEGLNWANQNVRYYVGYENLNDDRLEFSNAITYNLVNDKIVKTKLENEGSFKNKVNKYWKEKTITLPDVKVGSIIEYKYVLKSENLVKFPDFDFQYSIPVNYFEYKTQIPEVYIYKTISVGGFPIESDSKLVSGTQSYENEHNQTNVLTYRQINTVYSGKNVPALLQEPFVDNIENYRGSLHQELERIRYTDKPDKDYSKTWEGVAATIFKDDNFGKELNERDLFTSDISRLLKDVNSPLERLNVIFKFVQARMNWNDSNSCYTEDGIAKAYNNQIGNVAEINFILINMLKLAGIDANPVLVSTIENGIPVYPTRTGFNYVIVAANIEGNQILLDATHKFTSPNILPLNILNWKGRLIKSNGTSSEIDLVPTKLSRDFSSVIVKIDPSGKMEGKVRRQRTDYEAYNFRIENGGKNEDNYLEKLEENWGNFKITEYKIENKKNNFDMPVIETFSFKAENQFEIIGGRIFINPLLFFTRTKNPFNQEKRQMPIYFGYPNQEKENLNIEIPEGYVIESLPSPIKISSENGEIVYSLNISSTGNQIQIGCSQEIKNNSFEAEQYNGLKDIFQKVIASQTEKIVLKKA
jgi:hypothetical protein